MPDVQRMPDSKDIMVQDWIQMSEAFRDTDCRIPLNFCVTGYSMFPLIRNQKDRVTIIAHNGQINIGDIVLLQVRNPGGNYVLHRVCKMKDDQIQTLGDGNLHFDPWLPASVVCGVAVQIQRGRLTISPGSFFWKKAGLLWMALFPLRPLLLRGIKTIGKCCGTVRKVIRKGQE